MLSKEQAIEFLKEYTETNFSERCRDAHNMAIKALEQPTMDKAMIHTLAKENDELKAEIGRLRQALEQQPSEDCVSRQAVIKELNDNWLSGTCAEDYEHLH